MNIIEIKKNDKVWKTYLDWVECLEDMPHKQYAFINCMKLINDLRYNNNVELVIHNNLFGKDSMKFNKVING